MKNIVLLTKNMIKNIYNTSKLPKMYDHSLLVSILMFIKITKIEKNFESG